MFRYLKFKNIFITEFITNLIENKIFKEADKTLEMPQISYASSSNYSMFVIVQKAINASESLINSRHLSKYGISSNVFAVTFCCPKCLFLQFVLYEELHQF